MAISDNTLSTLLNAPQPNQPPDEFNANAYAFAAILHTLGIEINATVAALNLNATNSTSTDSLAIGMGDKNFEVEPNKSYSLGMSVRIAADIDPTNWMNGDLIAYDPLTGNISVHVTSIQGSGTYTAWSISQSIGGLTSGSVDTDKIADLAVTEEKLTNLAITTAKLANSSATLAKLDRTGAEGKILTAHGVDQAPTWEDNLKLGFGQSWQSVTDSRASNTNYTNSTGKPIQVNIYSVGSGGQFNLIVDGITVAANNPDVSAGSTATVIVPNNSVYSFTGSFFFWTELR